MQGSRRAAHKARLRLIADRNRTLISSVRDNRELAKLPNGRALFLVFVLRLCATLFDHITHIAQYKDRKGSHALLLFGSESPVKWLPRIGKLLKVGGSLC